MGPEPGLVNWPTRLSYGLEEVAAVRPTRSPLRGGHRHESLRRTRRPQV